MATSPIKPLSPITARDYWDLVKFLLSAGPELLKISREMMSDPKSVLLDRVLGCGGLLVFYGLISAVILVCFHALGRFAW